MDDSECCCPDVHVAKLRVRGRHSSAAHAAKRCEAWRQSRDILPPGLKVSRPRRHGLRSYGRALMLSCCPRFLRGTTEAADCVVEAELDCGGVLDESPGGMSADSPQACVGAAPGMLLADASPALDSLLPSCHSAVRVDQLFDHVYGNLKHCHGVFEVDQYDHVYGSLHAPNDEVGPPGLLLQARPTTATTTTGDYDNWDYDYHYNYYHYSTITPLPLYCCAQGDPMPRASRERGALANFWWALCGAWSCFGIR